MNKLYVLENLNNAIAREQNTREVLMARKKYLILDKFFRKEKRLDDVIHINFWAIFIGDITYDIGKIQTKYQVEIDVNDVVDIKYEGEVKLKLERSNFLNVGREEIWKVGGIKKVMDKSIINGTNVGGDDDNIWYQNKYDFKINGWKVPRDSFLTLRSSIGCSKKNILGVLIRYRVYMFLKFDEIFNLERC
jgi:hypothetical protein